MYIRNKISRRCATKLGISFLVGTGLTVLDSLISKGMSLSKNNTLDSLKNEQSLIDKSLNNHLAFNSKIIVGAQIDKSKITRTIHVNIAHPNALDTNPGWWRYPLKTISAALKMAKEYLSQGKGIRIRIHSGVYREGEFTIDGNQLGSKAQNAVLVIEGKGKVIISGSEIWQPETWDKIQRGDTKYYQHDWEYDFGNDGGAWGRNGPKELIAHRSEMVFINDIPLKQVILEQYNYNYPNSFSGKGNYHYLNFLAPENALQADTFGVAELDRNGNKIYIRPKDNLDFEKSKIEVATKRFLFRFFNLSNVHIDNITFQHTANVLEIPGAAVLFGPWRGENKFHNSNILITRCEFRWNNTRGLSILNSRNVSLMSNKSNYNGFSGITAHTLKNARWWNNETSYNNWRGYQSGFTGWAIAGAKIHSTRDFIIRKHKSLGNNTVGLWFDIANRNILIDKAVIVENIRGLQLEISPGPFVVSNSLLASNQDNNFLIDNSTNITLTNSIVYAGNKGDSVQITSSLDRKYNDNIGIILGETNTQNVPIYLANTQFNNNIIYSEETEEFLILNNRGNYNLYKDFLQKEYEGKDNIYFAPTHKAFGIGFQKNKMTNLNGWVSFTGEKKSRWLPINFSNPKNYNFNFNNSTAKQNLGKNLPKLQLDDVEIKKINDFFNWVNEYLMITENNSLGSQPVYYGD